MLPSVTLMNLLKALAQTSSMTLLSRILGFIRDASVAHVFGAGGLTDAFFVKHLSLFWPKPRPA